MNVIAVAVLEKFWRRHPKAKGPLEAWYHELVSAEWKSWTDLKKRFPSADPLGEGRYVFNIGGNKFRLVALIQFDRGVVLIKFIGTHAEYDKINAKEVGPR